MAAYERKSLMDEEMDAESGDREISLSPAIILGVFLALALVCAVFFGFGYSVGRRTTPAAMTVPVNSAPPAVVGFGSKPSPGSVAGASRSSRSEAPSPEDGGPNEVAQPAVEPGRSAENLPSHRPSAAGAGASATPAVGPATTAKSTTIFHPPAVVSPTTAAPTAASPQSGSIVQVAAFSHQQDAELVAGALRKRGYDIAIRQQPQDSLLHVQLGPFASKKEADAMRLRLQSDGYNAIVK